MQLITGTAAYQQSNSAALPYAVTVGTSPFVYQNTNKYPIDVIIRGGTVTTIEFSRDNVTYYNIGLLSGSFGLSPNDRIRITYTLQPTVTGVPR